MPHSRTNLILLVFIILAATIAMVVIVDRTSVPNWSHPTQPTNIFVPR